jgi:hypothetical protein
VRKEIGMKWIREMSRQINFHDIDNIQVDEESRSQILVYLDSIYFDLSGQIEKRKYQILQAGITEALDPLGNADSLIQE